MAAQHNLIDYHPKGANINEFHMLELLKGMRGKEFEVKDNKRHVKISMEGNDVLKINYWDSFGVSVEELPDLCQTYYEKFKEETYKERYPTIKNLLPVYDKDITEKLDKMLVTSIQKKMKNQNCENSEAVSLSYPWAETLAEFENVKFMNFKKQEGNKNFKSQENVCELMIENYLDLIRSNGAEKRIFEKSNTKEILERLDKHKVHFTATNNGDKSSEKINDKKVWSVKKCLNFDTKLEGKRYILIDSSWYMVDLNYFVTLMKHFEEKLSPSTLPPYTKECNEAEYNAMACDTTGYLLMDNVTVPINKEDRNKFEFCDILTKEAKMYHVKKYDKLSTFGYVFNQAQISASLIQRDNVFKNVYKKVMDKKGVQFADAIKTIKYNPSNATFCIAVIAKRNIQDLKLTIQSLIVFHHATKYIEKFGYKVVFEWVNDETLPKLKSKQSKLPQFIQPNLSNSSTAHSESSISDSGISNTSSSLKSTTKILAELNMSEDYKPQQNTSFISTKLDDDGVPYKKKRSLEAIEKKE